MKKCSKCKLEKDLTDFTKNQYSCKSCNRKYDKEYQIKNQEKLKEYRLKNQEKQREYYKEYSLKNKEKIAEKSKRYSLDNKAKSREKFRRHYLKNKEGYNAHKRDYIKKRRETNLLFRISSNIRSSIRKSINKRGYSKTSKTFDILGCDFETFKLHIEKQFTKGMNWNNHGEWHLDHIYPVSLARNEKHLIELNHYTNFQPLWAIDNLIKSDKIIEKQLFLL